MVMGGMDTWRDQLCDCEDGEMEGMGIVSYADLGISGDIADCRDGFNGSSGTAMRG